MCDIYTMRVTLLRSGKKLSLRDCSLLQHDSSLTILDPRREMLPRSTIRRRRVSMILTVPSKLAGFLNIGSTHRAVQDSLGCSRISMPENTTMVGIGSSSSSRSC